MFTSKPRPDLSTMGPPVVNSSQHSLRQDSAGAESSDKDSDRYWWTSSWSDYYQLVEKERSAPPPPLSEAQKVSSPTSSTPESEALLSPLIPLRRSSTDAQSFFASSAGRSLEWPRLVLRNLPFNQSKNKVQIRLQQQGRLWRLVVLHDWFHVFLRVATWQSLLILLVIWTSAIIVFAGFYVWVDNQKPEVNCGLGPSGNPIHFGGAFAFSLETATTVGFGLPSGSNFFFEQCHALQVVIYFQMVWSMMFNGFLFAFFYSRLAKSEDRGCQVVFSKHAVVSRVPASGQVRLQIRIYDVDARSPVVDAHVRLLAITHARPTPRLLRLLQPNDEWGGKLFLSMPTVVIHHIDIYSLLHPPVNLVPSAPSPPSRSSSNKASAATSVSWDDPMEATRPILVDPSGLLLRQVDSVTNNREEVVCPICGESYGDFDRWVRHVRYWQILETKDEVPLEGSHMAVPEQVLQDASAGHDGRVENLAILRDYFIRHISEIICVVEGIDPLTSGSFSALQSYRAEDIVWNERAEFAPCMEVHNDSNCLMVNLDQFQAVSVRAPPPTPTEEAPLPDREGSVPPVQMPAPDAPIPRRSSHRVRAVSFRAHDGLVTR